MKNVFENLASKIKKLTNELAIPAKEAVQTFKRTIEVNGTSTEVSITVKAIAARHEDDLTDGLVGLVDHYETRLSIPMGVVELTKSIDINGYEKSVLAGAEATETLAQIFRQVQAKLGLSPTFGKPVGIVAKYSTAKGMSKDEVTYLTVDRKFVAENNGLAFEGEEGAAAVANKLHNMRKTPLSWKEMSATQRSAASKYFNHGSASKLVDVIMHIPKNKIVQPGHDKIEADGASYFCVDQWKTLFNENFSLTVTGWKLDKVLDLLRPRVTKPVAFGKVFGKGTLIPLSKKAWVSRFPELSTSLDGKVVIVGDRNFCKMIPVDAKADANGNMMIPCQLGLHDSPMFGKKKVLVSASTLLRCSLTIEQITAWAKIATAHILEHKKRMESEGPNYLVFRNLVDKDEESNIETLEKDAWITQGIFRASDASKALSEAKAGLVESIFAVPAYQMTAYAIPLSEEVYQDVYVKGGASAHDIVINPEDLAEYLELKGLTKITNRLTKFVCTRHPAISPTAMHQCRIFTHPAVPRKGLMGHPLIQQLKSCDFDGDGESIRHMPGMPNIGHEYNLKDLRKIPVAKGANTGTFPEGNYAGIISQQIICQSATGIVDGAAFAAVMRYTNNNPAVCPDWEMFATAEKNVQDLLTGAKKLITFSEVPQTYKDLLVKLLTGKKANIDKVAWQKLSAEVVIENLVKFSKKGYPVNTPSKFLEPAFMKAVEDAITLSSTIELKGPEYVFDTKGTESIPLYSEITNLDNTIRPDGMRYVDGSHAIAVETLRLYIKRVLKEESQSDVKIENFLANYISFVAAIKTSNSKAREGALHWAQKLLGTSVNADRTDLTYHLVVRKPVVEDNADTQTIQHCDSSPMIQLPVADKPQDNLPEQLALFG